MGIIKQTWFCCGFNAIMKYCLQIAHTLHKKTKAKYYMFKKNIVQSFHYKTFTDIKGEMYLCDYR